MTTAESPPPSSSSQPPPLPLPGGTAVVYRVRMLTDWHVGTGTGRPGEVDRLVARDPDGLPYLPAKTVTGMWRDACEVAARALDADDSFGTEDSGTGPDAGITGTGGSWAHLVDVLFGSQPASVGLGRDGGQRDGGQRDGGNRAGRMPRPAALSVRSARYRKPVRDAVAAEPSLRGAVTFRKAAVRLDAGSGRADVRGLRFAEQARAGAVLEGTVVLDPAGALDDETRRYATALLVAGGVLVEQVGGNRRRGGGRCALWLPSIASAGGEPGAVGDAGAAEAGVADGHEAWWRWLDEAPPPPPVSAPDVADAEAVFRTSASGSASSATDAGWDVADLRITLRDPLLLAPRTTGNEAHSVDFVPGATMLPVVLGRLGPVATGALLDGRLVVTDATVEIGDEPGRPAPRILRASKALPAAFFNVAAESAETPVEPLRGGYVGEALPLTYVVPSVEGRTHNSVDDASQRPTRNAVGGGAFTYEALSRTVLRAQVRVVAGVLSAGWQYNLAGRWTLGRSRKDEYGRVDVEASPGQAPPVRPAFAGGRRVVVWLLSDLLLLDERLAPSTDPKLLRRAVAEALGVPETALTEPDRTEADFTEAHFTEADFTEAEPRSLASNRTDSWQSRWGLPRPSLLTFAAGSVVSYDVSPSVTLSPELVAEVETAGLGERRGEGLGQVRLAVSAAVGEPVAGDAGPELLTAKLGGAVPVRPGHRPPASAAPAAPAAPAALAALAALAAPADLAGADDRAVVVNWRREAWRAEIARRVTSCAAARHDIDPTTGRSHPSAVLGRQGALGAGVERVPSSQLEQLRELLPRLGDVDHVRAWLRRVSDPKQRRPWPPPVTQAVALLLADDPGRVWTVLGWKKTDLDDDPELRAELWAEAVTSLVLACLASLRRSAGPAGSARSPSPARRI